MIVQQVNLYQDSLKQKHLSIGFYLLIATAFIVLIGFGLIDAYLVRSLNNDRHQVEQALKQLAIAQAQVKLLESTIPRQDVDPELTAEIDLWQKKMTTLKKTIEILDNNDSVRSQGFSAYFEALANQPVSEVWLTMIRFDAQQQRINLAGSSFKADKIPYFLQQLQKEPAFHGRTFAQLQIEKSESSPNLMNFKLSTHLESVKKDHVE